MKVRAICVSIALATSLFARAQDDTVRVEVLARPVSAWTGQIVTVEIRLSIDGAFFERSAIQVFRQKLDLPVQVDAPWLTELDGARRSRDLPIAPDARASLAAAGELVFARAREAAAQRDVYVLERRFRMERPGRLALAAPTIRYAWATRFTEDFIGERRPVDRKIVVVEGNPLEIVVRPLPTEGRPASFGGAVGQFRITAERGDPREDQSLAFALRIEGEGDFETLVAPRLDGLVGLHARGLRESRTATSLTLHADLVVTDASAAFIPGIAFSWFDPVESRYIEQTTKPLLVSGRLPSKAVTSRATTADSESEATPGSSARSDTEFHDILPIDVKAGRRRGDDPGATSWWLMLSLCFSPWLIGLGFLAARKFEARKRRSRAGLAALARRVIELEDADERHIENTFAAYLAERIERLPPAIVRDDLEEQLTEHGISAELARASSEAITSLVSRRYGERCEDDVVERTKRVVRLLEAERLA